MRILAIDLGTKNTGLSITDIEQTVISPLKTIRVPKGGTQAVYFAIKTALVDYWDEISEVVIGNSEDPEYPSNAKIASWQKKLYEIFCKNTDWAVHMQVESFSTIESMELLKSYDLSNKQILKYKDAYASCIILSNFVLSRGRKIDISI